MTSHAEASHVAAATELSAKQRLTRAYANLNRAVGVTLNYAVYSAAVGPGGVIPNRGSFVVENAIADTVYRVPLRSHRV